jgi:hypothetical protein
LELFHEAAPRNSEWHKGIAIEGISLFAHSIGSENNMSGYDNRFYISINSILKFQTIAYI